MADTWRWLWKGKVLRVIDGDTIEVMADRGYGDYRKMRLRLKDIDTPELNSKDELTRAKAIIARDELSKLLPVDTDVTFESFKISFDRYVANVWRSSEYAYDEYGSLQYVPTVQDMLVESGYAVRVTR